MQLLKKHSDCHGRAKRLRSLQNKVSFRESGGVNILALPGNEMNLKGYCYNSEEQHDVEFDKNMTMDSFLT